MEIDDGMMIMKSCIFPDYEFIHEFSAMTNIVKSWLNSYQKKEFTYEILAEFINPKSI